MDEYMEALKKLSREAQIVLGGVVLFLILSFFDWQSYSVGPFSFSKNLWNGFGIFVILIAIALLVWEVLRLLERAPQLGDFGPPIISFTLSVLLGMFTLILFFVWSQDRAWAEWLGTVIAIVIAVCGFLRAKAEGVGMPKMPAVASATSGRGATASAAPAPAAPPAAPEPSAPAEDAGAGETSEA